MLTTDYFDTGIRNTDSWTFGGTAVLTNTYQIDGLGRIDGIKQDVATSAGGSLKELDKSISIAYNSDGSRSQLSRYSDAIYGTGTGNLVANTNFSYFANGQRQLEYSNTSSTLGGYTISRYENQFDSNGRLSSVDTELYNGSTLVLDQKQTFEYDAEGRLKREGFEDSAGVAEFVPAAALHYRYDTAGNRIGKQGSKVGLANRLLSDPAFFYEYDNEGNVKKKWSIVTGTQDRTEYQWDHRNLLLRAEKYEGNSLTEAVDYTYDVLGRRVGKKVTDHSSGGPDITENLGYIYDGNSMVFEFDLDSGDISRNFLYGPGINEVLAVDQYDDQILFDHQTIWTFADRLGSVPTVGYVDNGGQFRVLHRNFDADGNQIPFAGTFIPGVADDETRDLLGEVITVHRDFLESAPIIFAGHQWDESLGLYNMKARLYDPITARFYSVDPLGIASGDANLYRYVAGDPVNNIDPTGQIIVSGSLALAGSYLLAQGGFAAAETAVEVAAVQAFGTSQDAANFSVLGAFGKNFAINVATFGIGGKAKTAGRVAQFTTRAALFAGRQAIEIGGDTAFDVFVGGRDFGSSLTNNAIGSVLGEAGGRAIGAGIGAFRRNFEITVDRSGVFIGSGLSGSGGLRIQPRLFRRISSQGLPIFQGGLPNRRLFERLRGANLDPPSNFPGIDRINRTTRLGTSLKTLDLRSAFASNPLQFQRRIRSLIEGLRQFDGPISRTSSVLRADVEIPALRFRRLEIGLQANTLSTIQRDILRRESLRASSFLQNPVELFIFEIF